MIENNKQYHITLAWIKRFAEDELLLKVQLAAVQGELTILRDQIEVYETEHNIGSD